MIARALAIFVAGSFLAGQMNRGIYRLAWHPRDIGPWSKAHRDVPTRQWYDRIPILGWWWMRRESTVHGRGFWIRPLLIELAVGLGFAWLYLFECDHGLVPAGAIRPVAAGILHAQYLSHVILLSLLIVATFIDIDEKTIPDEITVPGTVIGLILATLLPQSLLPIVVPVMGAHGPFSCQPLLLTTPHPWDPWLEGQAGLLIGLAAIISWCYAIVPKTWWTRGGAVKAIRYLLASMVRHPLSRWVAALCVLGCIGVMCGWWIGGAARRGLLTALVGMWFGGAIVWAVRFIGTVALQREAMGFGDVTLLAMIGAFVGWQSALIIFFLAPFTGILIAVTQWLLTGRKDIAYGPFLSRATLILILNWATIWQGWGLHVFWLGWFIPAITVFCLLLMGVMLLIWRAVVTVVK